MTYWEAASWIISIVLFDHYVCGWIRCTLNTALPATVLGGYPETHGWLHIVDVVFGLALVAYSEEIVFRRCARHLFQIYLNDGYALVVVTSLLFGAYHWWTGIGNIVEAVLMGVLLMLFYRRSAALWPVVLGYYLTDIVDFRLRWIIKMPDPKDDPNSSEWCPYIFRGRLQTFGDHVLICR